MFEKRGLRVVAAVMVAALVLSLVLFAMSAVGGAPVAVEAGPLDTLYWCGANTYCAVTLQSGDGITASAASENYVRQSGSIVYNRAELYSTVDVSDSQTITVKLQYSPDGSNWIDHASGGITAQTADGTGAVSITSLSGMYWRAYQTVVTTATVTPTLMLVLKRTQ